MNKDNKNDGIVVEFEDQRTAEPRKTAWSRVKEFAAAHPVGIKIITGSLLAGGALLLGAFVKGLCSGRSTDMIETTEQITIEGVFEPEDDTPQDD